MEGGDAEAFISDLGILTKGKMKRKNENVYSSRIVEYIFSNVGEKYAGQNLNIQALTIKARRRKNLHNQVKGGHPA